MLGRDAHRPVVTVPKRAPVLWIPHNLLEGGHAFTALSLEPAAPNHALLIALSQHGEAGVLAPSPVMVSASLNGDIVRSLCCRKMEELDARRWTIIRSVALQLVPRTA